MLVVRRYQIYTALTDTGSRLALQFTSDLLSSNDLGNPLSIFYPHCPTLVLMYLYEVQLAKSDDVAGAMADHHS